jgi:hypothetical protein
MAKKRGILTDFRLDDNAGSLTDISQQCDSVDLSNDVESFDVTTFQSANKEYLVGFSDGKISFSGFYDGTLIAHLMGLITTSGSGASRSFQWGPEGSTTGLPKFTGEGFLTSFKPSSKVNEPNKFTAELQITGAITVGTYA